MTQPPTSGSGQRAVVQEHCHQHAAMGFGPDRAEHALLPAVRTAAADTLLIADGFSCRTQTDNLTGRRSLHLAQVLAHAMDIASAD